MTLIIKTRGNQPIADNEKKWAEAKFMKLGKLMPAESVVEVTLEDMYGPKKGIDKKVHVLAELPHVAEPFHLEEIDVNFRKAITTARDRFERYLKRNHEKHQTLTRHPRKFWIAKVLERFTRRRVEAGVASPDGTEGDSSEQTPE